MEKIVEPYEKESLTEACRKLTRGHRETLTRIPHLAFSEMTGSGALG